MKALLDYEQLVFNLKQKRRFALEKHNPLHNQQLWRNLFLEVFESVRNSNP